MTKCKSIIIDGTEYTPGTPAKEGTRRIVVLDRGWIFAGNLEGKRLTNVVNVRSWKTGGFGGLTRSAKDSGAVLDASEDLLLDGWIFCVAVSDDWGNE